MAWRVPLSDIEIGGWYIPKSHYVVTSPAALHNDPAIWCAGINAHYPVEEFHAERWLTTSSTGKVEFTPRFAKGAWIPFGAGYHICPGRRFAKFAVFLFTALLVTMYYCDFLSDAAQVGTSMRNFGFGTLGPDRKVPVRMRRRAPAAPA